MRRESLGPYGEKIKGRISRWLSRASAMSAKSFQYAKVLFSRYFRCLIVGFGVLEER